MPKLCEGRSLGYRSYRSKKLKKLVAHEVGIQGVGLEQYNPKPGKSHSCGIPSMPREANLRKT